MGYEPREVASGTAFWIVADDKDRRDSFDTTTHQTYAAKDDPRLYCDKCARCLVYGCTGQTAVHHYIHIDPAQYFSDEELERVSPGAGDYEHADRDSGL